MRNGTCPSCGSTTIYSRPGGAKITETGHIRIITGSAARSRPVPYVSYVCTTCGLFENYLANADKLAEVAQTWQKVPPAAK